MNPWVERRVVWVLALVLLSGCSFGQFTFRGLSKSLSCDAAVTQEKKLGSQFVRTELIEERKTGHVRQEYLNGSLEDRPVEVMLECIEVSEDGGSWHSELFSAAYLARSATEKEALGFHERVRGMLMARYGRPQDEVKQPYKDLPAAKAKGTSELKLRLSHFGCFQTTLGIGDHSLGVVTQYPVADHTMFETTVGMRFSGGVC